jgi:hypothetical protein
MLKNKQDWFRKECVLAMIVIVVTALVLASESDSFGFRGGDRDFRKITIVSPLGGETFVAGSKQIISWQASRSITYVRIEYSIDNGKKWIEIVKNMKMDTTAESYEWEVPCTPTTKAKIRVTLFPSYVMVNPAKKINK